MNAMMAAGQALGYSPLFLCGYDLGFPNNQYRFQNYKQVKGKWEKEEIEWVPEDRPTRVANNGVLSDERSFFYKYSTMILYGLNAVPLISCSRGILSEIPELNAAEVVECQGKDLEALLRTPIDAYKVARQYLRYRNIHIRKTGSSVSVVNPGYHKWPMQIQSFFQRWWWWYRLNWNKQAEKAMKKRLRRLEHYRKKLLITATKYGYTKQSQELMIKGFNEMEDSGKDRYERIVGQMKFMKDRDAITAGTVQNMEAKDV